jgi:hypothetical protein
MVTNMNGKQKDIESHWHLDKKVPISLIAALLVQFAGGLWFMSKLESRVLSLEGFRDAQHERDEQQDKAVGAAQDKLYRRLETIDAKLDRLIERQK